MKSRRELIQQFLNTNYCHGISCDGCFMQKEYRKKGRGCIYGMTHFTDEARRFLLRQNMIYNMLELIEAKHE